jgi:hypothetical protein
MGASCSCVSPASSQVSMSKVGQALITLLGQSATKQPRDTLMGDNASIRQAASAAGRLRKTSKRGYWVGLGGRAPH